MSNFDYSAIVTRIRDRLQNLSSRMEGTWSMDNVQAVAQEMAMMVAMEVEVIPDRVLIDTAVDEYLDRKAKDYGEVRLEGESDDAFRARILQKIQNPITSGNKNHYIYWAKQVKGVADAKCVERWDGPGTVKVIILSTQNEVPDDDLVSAVYHHIEEERPVCVEVPVSKAQPLEVDISITVVVEAGYSPEDIQREITADVRAYVDSIAFSGMPLSYYRIGDRIFNADGVADIISYSINGGTASLIASYEQFFKLREVTISVSD